MATSEYNYTDTTVDEGQVWYSSNPPVMWVGDTPPNSGYKPVRLIKEERGDVTGQKL